jgi:integrase
MVRYIHTLIHGALEQAVKEGLVSRNVAEAVELPKDRKKEFTPLTPKQVRQFLTSIKGDRLYAAFLLELGTGLREGELFALRWQDIDFKNGVLTVRQTLTRVKGQPVFKEPKTEKSRRTVPIPQDILSELKVHRARQAQEKLLLGPMYQDKDLVFATVDGRPLEKRSFLRHFEDLLAKSGLPHVRFHDLRHTYATLLLQAGEHPKVVQELLGHAQISTTLDIYSHVLPELKQAAAAKLNKLLSS